MGFVYRTGQRSITLKCSSDTASNAPRRVTERITHETEQNVGIWAVTELKAAMESGELAEGEAQYREHASDPSANGCVIDIETDGSVGE